MDFCRKQLKSDCEQLLSRFQGTDLVRFEVFSGIWREMNFAHIFYGTTGRERRPFSRLALDSASSFFLPPFSFQIRVGGLYLLYSLYQCQTSSPPEQIRLALKDWSDVEKFEKDAVDAQHLDAVYILRRLMSLKAFHFVAVPTLLTYKKKRKAEKSTLCEEFVERASGPQELINMDLLEELSNVHGHYQKLKTSVGAASGSGADRSVDLIREDLVPQLRGTVVDFYRWQQKTGGPADEEEEGGGGGEGTSSQQQSSRRASLLASIKSRAYGEATEACKSRRHRQVELEVGGSSGEVGPSGAPGHSKINKLSLKARTNESVHISGDVWTEAASTTHISRLTVLDSVPKGKAKKKKKFKW